MGNLDVESLLADGKNTSQPDGKETKPIKKGYFSQSRRWLYAFSFVIPLALIYEIAVLIVNGGSIYGIRNGADIWVKRIINLMGMGTTLPLLVLSLLAWVAIYYFTKRKEPDFRFRWSYFGWMLLESAAWGLVLLLAVGYLTYLIFNLSPTMSVGTPIPIQLDKGTQLAISFGAGVYEELVFRVVLMGGLIWLLKHFGMRSVPSTVLSVIASSLMFSGAHYIGSMGDTFQWESFANRAIAGMAFASLYAWRGYGVTAWAHALYDVYIILCF